MQLEIKKKHHQAQKQLIK